MWAKQCDFWLKTSQVCSCYSKHSYFSYYRKLKSPPDCLRSEPTFLISVSPFFFWAAISVWMEREEKQNKNNCDWLIGRWQQKLHSCCCHLSSPSEGAFLWLVAPTDEVHWSAASPVAAQGYSRRWCPEALWGGETKDVFNKHKSLWHKNKKDGEEKLLKEF